MLGCRVQVQGPGCCVQRLSARLWVQGPGCRDLVQGAGCNVLGAKPWAACARGTACAADDADRTELSLEDGAGSSLLRSPCPEEEGQEPAVAGRPPGLGARLGESLGSRAQRLCFRLNWCYCKLTVSRCEICYSCSKDQMFLLLPMQPYLSGSVLGSTAAPVGVRR